MDRLPLPPLRDRHDVRADQAWEPASPKSSSCSTPTPRAPSTVADAYQAWLQALTDEALARSKEHFEIPEVMDRCEALIPPEGSAAAAYYTGPSEDFSRPGRTWYPTLGRTMFPRWGEVTTCYHESVPGHHLQIGYAKVQAASLSRIQRSSFIPGHGEGWALYAEQLCDEFGWFENPDYRLGFLGGQMLRTVRVIIDIGMHLGKKIPDGTTLNDGTAFHGGEVWTPDHGLRVLRQGDRAHCRLHAQRDRSLPRLAGAGHQLQDRPTRMGRRTRRRPRPGSDG